MTFAARVAMVLSCALALAGAQAVDAQTLLWSASMKTLGWSNSSSAATWNKDFDVGMIDRQQLAVNAAGQVYAGFGVFGPDPGMARTLRVVALDGKTGALLRQMDFPTPMLDRAAVLAAQDGTLLVIAGDKVQRVDSQGVTQSSVPLPPQPNINPALWVTESPSGRTLLLTTDEKTFRFVRTDTLATEAECYTPKNEIDELNDDVAISMVDGLHGFELHAGKLCGPMSLLWPLSGGRSSDVRLLDDRSVLEIGLNGARRLTLNDRTMWSWKSPQQVHPETNDGIAISISGERVAFPLVQYRTLPRSPCSNSCPFVQFDAPSPSASCRDCITPRFESSIVGIVVLDAATGKQFAMVAVDNGSENSLAFALSPDGHRLAILKGTELQFWSL